MKFRYEQLFNIGFKSAYYVDNRRHDDLVIEATRHSKDLMSRYRILSKKTFDGMALLFECDPLDDTKAFKPIAKVERFTFKVTVTNPDLWYYADVNGWETDKVYFLKNPLFNTTGDINVLTGPLNAPVLFRPMEFKYEVLLENVQGLLEVRDNTGALIKTIVVRAKKAGEAADKKEAYLIGLQNLSEGLYRIRHKTGGGDVDEDVYCSPDHAPGTLAVIEISYKNGPWTGTAPFQKYIININSRPTDWFFDVHISKKPVAPVLASQLSIKHIPTLAEPLKTFTVVPGSVDDVKGFVQFKSSAKLSYSQKPIHLRLTKPNLVDPPNPHIVLDMLPLPSSDTVQKDALDNLFTKIIVNI